MDARGSKSRSDRSASYVQRVDDTWEVTQNRQEDIDQEVAAAATLEEYAERRQDDGNDDLADVAGV